MAASKKFIIIPPAKGYAELNAFAEQPPGTSPDILNVAFIDPDMERFRIAQRAGVGLYDLVEFSAGSALTLPTIHIPGNGGPPEQTVNLPRRDCWTITPDSSRLDMIIAYGDVNGTTCGPATVGIGGQPNSGPTDLGGTITANGPGGPVGIPWTQPPADPGAPPHLDPKRPFLKVKKCSDGSYAGFWIHQSVLAVHNALPALRDKATGTCYLVSGQRAATASPVRDQSEFDVLENCAQCGTSKHCYDVYHAVFTCNTGTWSAPELEGTECLYPDNVPATNAWVFDQTLSAGVVRYKYFKDLEEDCSGDGDCDADGIPPATPGFTPTECDPCGQCGGDDQGTVTIGDDVEANPDINANGSYTYESFAVVGGLCTWLWRKDVERAINVTFDPATGVWSCYTDSVDDTSYSATPSMDIGLSCHDGTITGTVALVSNASGLTIHAGFLG